MNSSPPKYALRFFRWFCDPDYVDDIEGDLLERFVKRTHQNKAAKWLLTMDVLKLFRPGIIRKFEGTQKLNNYGMLKHNLKISWRNALRQKQFTTLNLLGLTIGIATAITIGLFIHDELTYDTFHEKGDRIYRVNQPNIWGDWGTSSSTTGPNVATALREEAPEFEEVTRILTQSAQIVRPSLNEDSDVIFKESNFFAAEHNFLNVFSFELLAGDPATALQQPRNAILTLETAHKYFGNDYSPSELLGKQISVKAWDGKWETFSVSAIAANIPNKSHIQFDVLVSLTSYQELMDMHGWKWIWTAFSTYGLVHPGVDVAALEEKLQALPPKWAAPTTEKIFNQSFEDFTAGHPWTLDLQPLRSIYSSSQPEFNNFGPVGNPLFVKIFAAIGLLVLVLSAINFMNLSTARSSIRSKEVGVRKVLGSQRRQIIKQFTVESILYVAISTVLALIIVAATIDWFNFITEKEMTLTILVEPIALGILAFFVLSLGLIAGSYPAFYLSGFRPIHALKGESTKGFKGKALRNVMVVFQFSISIALIICSSFVHKQITYASSLDLGFQKDNILQLHNIEKFGFDTEIIKSRLQSNSAITQVGKSFGVPPSIWSGDRYKAAGSSEVLQFNNLRTEGDYLDLLGLKFLAGRNFDRSRPADKYKVIINETAARMLGWGDASTFETDSPIGKKIALASGDEQEFEVIGLVNDFNFHSLRSEIRPLVVINHENDSVWDYGAGLSYYSLKLDPSVVNSSGDLMSVIDEVEASLAGIDNSVPFEFSFLDEGFEDTFRFEQKMSKVFNIFTLMAMTIGCLGLFGLTAFSAEQRTKELGIRKVLGANISELILKFSSEFTRLIAIAILIASPLAWYLVTLWLENFAYSTPLEIWVFVAAAFGAFLVALGTIGYQAVKSAQRNPVETLRDE